MRYAHTVTSGASVNLPGKAARDSGGAMPIVGADLARLSQLVSKLGGVLQRGGVVTDAQEVVLRRSAVTPAARLKFGIIVMNHDPADPAARLAVFEAGGGAQTVVNVRAGDTFEFAGRQITVTGVTPGYRPAGKVALTVTTAPRRESLLLSGWKHHGQLLKN
jgi:hypothetical protein